MRNPFTIVTYGFGGPQLTTTVTTTGFSTLFESGSEITLFFRLSICRNESFILVR